MATAHIESNKEDISSVVLMPGDPNRAKYIADNVGSELITYEFAGSSYKGAIEDVSNLKGIPAVTCEVLCPFASIGEGTVEKSLEQMKCFLHYSGF